MCLAIPMQIVEINGFNALCQAKGVERDVSLFMLQDEPLEPGDWGTAVVPRQRLITCALFDRKLIDRKRLRCGLGGVFRGQIRASPGQKSRVGPITGGGR